MRGLLEVVRLTPFLSFFWRRRVVRSCWNVIQLHDKIDLQADLQRIL